MAGNPRMYLGCSDMVNAVQLQVCIRLMHLECCVVMCYITQWKCSLANNAYFIFIQLFSPVMREVILMVRWKLHICMRYIIDLYTVPNTFK